MNIHIIDDTDRRESLRITKYIKKDIETTEIHHTWAEWFWDPRVRKYACDFPHFFQIMLRELAHPVPSDICYKELLIKHGLDNILHFMVLIEFTHNLLKRPKEIWMEFVRVPDNLAFVIESWYRTKTPEDKPDNDFHPLFYIPYGGSILF